MSEQTFHPVDAIIKKRDGHELTPEEIRAFVHGILTEQITPARTSALLMAIFQRGLTPRELTALTQAMRTSGEVFDASALMPATVDKHSTGGVGDKTSLLIAPIVAAAGLAVPMISGRSLGHTGGTLDKLETIPGYNTQLSMQQFGEVLADCNASMIGQTENLVPADRILYALRDHTGTVESPNLICASIMSKKLAEDLDALVLDVKTGSGAFMPTDEASRHLAQLLVQTGNDAGTRTVALLTSMDEPLGRFAGNWVEVWECIDVLQNRPHPLSKDMVDLSLDLSAWMLHLGGATSTVEAGRERAQQVLENGEAYQHWLRMVTLHGGDTSVFTNPAAHHTPGATRILRAETAGYLAGMDCKQVGWAVQRLGAGRELPGGPVSANAGIEMHAKIGDPVTPGAPLLTLFADTEAQLEEPERMLRETLRFTDTPVPRTPLIRAILGA